MEPLLLSGWTPAAVGFGTYGIALWALKWWAPFSILLGICAAGALVALINEYQVWHFRAPASSDGKDTCVVTGGTHGIGFEIAKVFARDGYNLIIIARYQGELEAARDELLRINPNIIVITIEKDLYTDEGADEVFLEIINHQLVRNQNLRINHLVNNVGMCIRGDFLELPLVDQLGMMKLNMNNCVKFSYLFGNMFKNEIDLTPNSTSKFRIMNLASFASIIVCPFLSTYSGTKAFVHSFSVAFNEELKAGKYKNRINCTSLCPGYTAAPSLPPAGIPNCVAWVTKNRDTPDRVARTGYKALMEGQFYVLVGVVNNLTYFLTSTLLPVHWTSKIGKFFNSDWEDLSWNKLQKEGLTAERGWKGGSVASQALRAGISKN